METAKTGNVVSFSDATAACILREYKEASWVGEAAVTVVRTFLQAVQKTELHTRAAANDSIVLQKLDRLMVEVLATKDGMTHAVTAGVSEAVAEAERNINAAIAELGRGVADRLARVDANVDGMAAAIAVRLQAQLMTVITSVDGAVRASLERMESAGDVRGHIGFALCDWAESGLATALETHVSGVMNEVTEVIAFEQRRVAELMAELLDAAKDARRDAAGVPASVAAAVEAMRDAHRDAVGAVQRCVGDVTGNVQRVAQDVARMEGLSAGTRAAADTLPERVRELVATASAALAASVQALGGALDQRCGALERQVEAVAQGVAAARGGVDAVRVGYDAVARRLDEVAARTARAASNSREKGAVAEAAVKEALEQRLLGYDGYAVQFVGGATGCGDICVRRTGGRYTDVLVEIKCWAGTVKQEEVEKFRNDVDRHQCHGVMLSLDSKIAGHVSGEMGMAGDNRYVAYLAETGADGVDMVVQFVKTMHRLEEWHRGTGVSGRKLTAEAMHRVQMQVHENNRIVRGMKLAAKSIIADADRLAKTLDVDRLLEDGEGEGGEAPCSSSPATPAETVAEPVTVVTEPAAALKCERCGRDFKRASGLKTHAKRCSAGGAAP